MAEHADGFLRPGPASEIDLLSLSRVGAPESLIALYRTVAQGPEGLLPSGSSEGACALRPAELVAYGRTPGVWNFGRGAAELFLVGEAVFAEGADGQRHKLADTLEEALERHLEDLLAGTFAWDAFSERFVAAAQLPDQGFIHRIVLEVTDEPRAFDLWLREIVEDLSSRRRAELPGLGHLELRVRSGSTYRQVAFHPGQMLKARLALPGQAAGRPSRAIALRGLPLARGAGQRLAATLYERMVEALLSGQPVDWPGLGRFQLETSGRGAPVRFRVWPSLKWTLNPGSRGSGP